MYPARSGSVVVRSAMDGSWAVTSQHSVLNPFGSFRHDGSFPASLISGSVTSRHLGEPPSDYSTSDAPSSVLEDSTHLYINMIERSDIGAVKSTKFWNESDDDDNTSEFSSIHANDDEDYDIDDDHRGNFNADCSPLPCDVTKSRGTPVQVSLKAILRLAGKPPMAPRHVKINTTSRQNQSDQQRRQSSSVQSKVGPWLQNIAHHSPDVVTPAAPTHKVHVGCYMSSVPSSFATDTYISQDDHTTASFDDHTNTFTEHTDQSCHSDRTTSRHGLPMDTLYHSHQINVTRCQPEYSVDSDATFFMQRPLTACGVARPKFNKRRGFTRQLKKIGRFFTKTSK